MIFLENNIYHRKPEFNNIKVGVEGSKSHGRGSIMLIWTNFQPDIEVNCLV